MEARIQSYLRIAASHQRDTEQIGPFLATFSHFSDSPYLNYAIPDDNATPSPVEVATLIAAYERRGRKPRLEYVAQLAPMVAEVLIDAGFCVEGNLPLMTCTPKSQQSLPVPPGIELILPVSDAELYATISVQNEAYGAAVPEPSAIIPLRNSLKAGGVAVLARTSTTGEPVGAGVCSIPDNQTTEIAGIGVRAIFRRRGVAGALVTKLAQEAFATGISVPFLMAAHEAEQRIYARAGFVVIGEILHISRSKRR